MNERYRSIWKKEEKNNAVEGSIDAEIAMLNLSMRSFNCLKRADCNTIGDILRLIADDPDGLKKIRNLGKRSEEEILTNLKQFLEEEEMHYKAGSGTYPCAGQGASRTVLIKPARKVRDMEIDAFNLSGQTLGRLKMSGIHQVKDLYRQPLLRDPGWIAVRELFEKLPRQ